MNYLSTTAYFLVAIGALSWGLIGVFDFNIVTFVFGDGSIFTKITYVVVGLSAVYSLFTHFMTE